MLVVGWALSGLIASSIVYTLYPKELSGWPGAEIVVVIFLLLGGLDYIATTLSKKNRRGIKFK